MLFTILSLIPALALLFIPEMASAVQSGAGIPYWIAASALVMLALAPLLSVITLIPLQKAQRHQTSFLLDLVRKDRPLFLMVGSLLGFVFLSILIAIGFSFGHKSVLLAVWFVLLGITFDVLHHLPKRISSFIDPFSTIQKLSHETRKSIQQERDQDLWQWIDALTEMATKGVYQRNIALANRAISELQLNTSVFLKSCKSISRTPDTSSQALTGQDEVSYTLFFLFDRFDIINDAAIKETVPPVCSHLIATLGKITVACAKFDLSLATYPLHFLGKFALEAQDRGFNDVAVKGTCTLVEVGKAILSDVDATYAELQPPFLSLVAIMENIAQGAFKKDKTTNIRLLAQPFKDLKDVLQQEKFANQQDVPVIIRDIDRVLNDFNILETVMKTIPPISSLTGQGSSTEQAPPMEMGMGAGIGPIGPV